MTVVKLAAVVEAVVAVMLVAEVLEANPAILVLLVTELDQGLYQSIFNYMYLVY